MTIRQLVAEDLGVTKSRVSQYVRAGMPLDSVANATRWVREHFRVRNWGHTMSVPTSIVHTTPVPKINFVRR